MYQAWILSIADSHNSIRNSLEVEKMKHNMKEEYYCIS